METGTANDAKPDDLQKDAASPEMKVGAAVNLSTKEWDQDLVESHEGDKP